MVRRLGLGKNNHLTFARLALNPRYAGSYSIFNTQDDITFPWLILLVNGFSSDNADWSSLEFLMACQSLWVILICLPEKGTKGTEELAVKRKQRGLR